MKNPPFLSSGAVLATALLTFTFPSSVKAQTVLADSVTEFSGVQGQDDWWYGYRNLTADGGTTVTYDPGADFIEFTGAQYTGTRWDIIVSGAPWTEVGPSAVHPNGTNNAAEQWATRRWVAPAADIAVPTLVEVEWSVMKTNISGGNAAGGVTGRLHVNGETKGVASIAGNDAVGITTSTILTLNTGDILDMACTPVGLDGSTGDGSDGSATTMIVRTVVDTDGDLLADAWEEVYFPGDLNSLKGGLDYDSDGLDDDEEQTAGSNPTLGDTDGDGLDDGIEVKTYGSNPNLADSDGDGIGDLAEVNGTPPTNPAKADTDDDGFSDPDELLYGSNPDDINETPETTWIADSRRDFSGIDGQDGWSWGYRNYTADGGATNYNVASDFIPFPVDGTTTPSAANFWNGNSYAWFEGSPPWTSMGREATHPNSGGGEHWTVRRWTASGLGQATPVRVNWHTRKGGVGGDGVTGSIHLDGSQVDTRTIGGGDTTGFVSFYFLNINDGAIIDQVLTPQGLTTRADGSDGSNNWITIDSRIPAVPKQPDGRYFIPVDAVDSEPDGLADFWEEEYFPGDLSQLSTGNDFDGDGANDEAEQAASTNPMVADTDGDGRSDGDELTVAPMTDPYVADTDGDGLSDGHEVSTGLDPNDPADNASTVAVAHSVLDWPANGEVNPQGQNGWSYGHYNTTAGGEPPVGTFIPFPSDGTVAPGAANFWNGTIFDWFEGNAPWTTISATGGHPNGDNNGDVHWAVRRWTANVAEPTPMAIHYHLNKSGAGGNGTSAVILQNGVPLDSITVGGTDTVGLTSWYFITAQPSDVIEVALTPRGIDDLDADGADSSAYWMIMNPTVPENAKQPDGSPFVMTGEFELRIVDFDYESVFGDITLRWTSRANKEYQFMESTDLTTWTAIGPTYVPDAGGETEKTLTGVGGAPRYFRVLELEP